MAQHRSESHFFAPYMRFKDDLGDTLQGSSQEAYISHAIQIASPLEMAISLGQHS
jgi:hypothetical protein